MDYSDFLEAVLSAVEREFPLKWEVEHLKQEIDDMTAVMDDYTSIVEDTINSIICRMEAHIDI
jgi:hypothetical protein